VKAISPFLFSNVKLVQYKKSREVAILLGFFSYNSD
jgi:hypothetical protein